MPFVAHKPLPTLIQLAEQGHDVLSVDAARRQDIRELHVGILNMMPDAALQATERQFIRLISSCNRIVQFYVHLFSLPELDRGDETRDYIARYYSTFEQLREEGLDALIITGANVASPHLNEQPFWEPLTAVVEWAEQNVTSILCSCLATHALVEHFHGIKREPLSAKRWGVYRHRLIHRQVDGGGRQTAPDHPLLRDINTRFDAPHSRHNDVSKAQLEAAGVTVLAEGEEGGVHLAVSQDQIRVVYFQGHPEYDVNSLLKEYKREVRRFARREIDAPPPHPENYFGPQAEALVSAFTEAVMDGAETTAEGRELEAALETELDNTWGDTAKAIINNWLGIVYQLTNIDRKRQFMSGVDPDDPLGLRANLPVRPNQRDLEE